jgi:hypothetical protein
MKRTKPQGHVKKLVRKHAGSEQLEKEGYIPPSLHMHCPSATPPPPPLVAGQTESGNFHTLASTQGLLTGHAFLHQVLLTVVTLDSPLINHYWFSYWSTPWSRVLLEKLVVTQLVKKFLALRNPKDRYRVPRSPPLVPILRESPLNKSELTIEKINMIETEAGDWRRLHNEELHNLYVSPNIIRVITSRRLRWAGM